MVYRGKPAKGCKTCRQRRIKACDTLLRNANAGFANVCQCDLKPDGCTPCARAAKPCPLYRSELDTMFCDQTEVTVKKAASKASKVSRLSDHTPLFEANARRSLVHTSVAAQITGERFLQPQSDDFALAYAYAHHVVRCSPGGNASVSTHHDGILSCMRALGMASYSAMQRCEKAAMQARRHYVLAIKSLNVDLVDPVKSKHDSTLLVVVSLSYFESMLGADEQSLTAWSSHINGTARLLELRGLDQVRVALGGSFYSYLTYLLTIPPIAL